MLTPAEKEEKIIERKEVYVALTPAKKQQKTTIEKLMVQPQEESKKKSAFKTITEKKQAANEAPNILKFCKIKNPQPEKESNKNSSYKRIHSIENCFSVDENSRVRGAVGGALEGAVDGKAAECEGMEGPRKRAKTDQAIKAIKDLDPQS